MQLIRKYSTVLLRSCECLYPLKIGNLVDIERKTAEYGLALKPVPVAPHDFHLPLDNRYAQTCPPFRCPAGMDRIWISVPLPEFLSQYRL